MFTGNPVFQHVAGSMHNIYSNYLIVAILTLFLGIATYTDIKSLKIPNALNLLFAIIGVALMFMTSETVVDGIYKLLGALVGFLVLFIPAFIKMHPMGGDIKAMTVIGLYIGVFLIPIFIGMAVVGGMLYILFQFKRGNISIFPFAPCFLFAHLTIFIGYVFIS